ncbi:UDP-glycosyltransferase 92A1-like [Panicum hallii]|nr:UDP-glycosyltransferase 92A1-like [Panicum hallii]
MDGNKTLSSISFPHRMWPSDNHTTAIVTHPHTSMATTRKKHVVLFPFPGQGHLAGFLAFAGLLRRELPDAIVTLVSTPRNVAALSSSAAAESSSIGLHALPFVPADHGLPAGCESTSSLPLHEFMKLFEAFDSLEPAFDGYVSGLIGESEDASATVCIVADTFVAWTVDVARRRGCAHAFFASCGAFGTAILHALWKNMPALPFGPDGALRLPEHLEVVLHRSQLSPVFLHGAGRPTAYHHRHLPRGYLTDAVISNTVEELEPTGLAMLRRTLGKVPVWPIGPLVRTVSQTETYSDDGVVRWLDAQQLSSVLYISFGSQNTIRANQMMDLAAALDATGRPFVWAIRPPVGFDTNGDEWLPDGFEAWARAGSRGLLVRGWAPQLRILAHRATAAFLSHCGWNSVLESLTHGVPLMGWPLSAEQFYNVKTLEEVWGVCVEVARGNLESSAVDRSKVAEVVEKVMGDTAESAAMRRRVKEAQQVLSKAWAEDGGSSRMALHEFLRAMQLQ